MASLRVVLLGFATGVACACAILVLRERPTVEQAPEARGPAAPGKAKDSRPTDAAPASDGRIVRPGPAESPGRRRAQVVYEAERGAAQGRDHPESAWAALLCYDELDDDAARWLLDRYLEELKSGRLDRTAMKLVLFCGGPAAADLLAARLTASDVLPDEETALKLGVGGMLEDGYGLGSVAVDARLEALSWQWLRSGNPVDRVAAVGLLGHVDTPESRAALRDRLTQSQDQRLQAAAALALARIGTADDVQALDAALRAARRRGAEGPEADLAFKRMANALSHLSRRLSDRR